jgi:hypothetical protein
MLTEIVPLYPIDRLNSASSALLLHLPNITWNLPVLKYKMKLLLEANGITKAELDISSEEHKNCQWGNNVNFVVARLVMIGRRQTNERNS